ncbi:MAG: DUF5615 family PIN-like protein [Dehalococcoidia bacterium]|nr:DUF5615 family PIN-like protein [Dehalococcoidia bacterium]
MNFVADECVDRQIVDRLRKEGHSVLYILEMTPGISDEEVIKQVKRNKAVLLTSDKDFGEIVFRQGQLSESVVLLRLGKLRAQRKAEIVSSAIAEHGHILPEFFVVITPEGIRIRKKVL